MKKLIILRRSSQAFFLLLFVYILWSTTYPLKGILPPETFFRTNPNIVIFTSVSERLFLPGLAVCLGMLVLTLFLGRFYCGWVCPLGTVIDLTGAARKKKIPVKGRAGAKLRKIKFFLLGAVLVSALFGVQAAWVLDPMVIMARFVSLNLIPAFTSVTDRFFVFLIRDLNLYGPVQDLYSSLKMSFLGVKAHYFANSGIIFVFFVLICITALLVSRLWCRFICPLGAFYSVVSRFAVLRRVADKCVSCGECVRNCRMGAINDDNSYVKGECILCMDCVYDCLHGGTRFTFFPAGRSSVLKKDENGKRGISRREFLFMVFSSVFVSGFKWGKKKENASPVIRPPGALREDEFLSRCVRCGNCMKVCPTNGLQPAMFQAGLEGIWTPHLVPEIGYCEYNCILCGSACPTGAIPRLKLEEKKKTKLGVANVDRSSCIAWVWNAECLICEEHCPVPEKAIRIKEFNIGGRSVRRPVVDPDLCIGCGICQTKCPVRPARAITVSPLGGQGSTG
ncbi:MAG: 4Fe-4S dicluster domain-containing protein [Candidatus Omnitrophota bacterium]|nr:4Fe-4S dicluster domain-containing protein [Candidatus Omnitrophota bacterium]